jgi:DNA-directed RNA polymerase subunit K/omega
MIAPVLSKQSESEYGAHRGAWHPARFTVRTTRRMRMAGAALAGDHIQTIAKNEALSREWVRYELASDECCQIMTGIINHHHHWIIELVSQTLKAIQEALKATRVVWCEGKMRELGADHFARLTAAKRLIELVTAGRPTPQSPESKAKEKTITLEELEVLLAGRRARQLRERAKEKLEQDGAADDIPDENVNSRRP